MGNQENGYQQQTQLQAYQDQVNNNQQSSTKNQFLQDQQNNIQANQNVQTDVNEKGQSIPQSNFTQEVLNSTLSQQGPNLLLQQANQKVFSQKQTNVEGSYCFGQSPEFKTQFTINPEEKTKNGIQNHYQPWLTQMLDKVEINKDREKIVDEKSEFVWNQVMGDQSRYEGYMKNGKRHGYGINLTENEYFEGSFQEGLRRGWGTRITQDTQESGFWENDKLQKSMVIQRKDMYYDGECFDSVPHGKGYLLRPNVSSYKGTFVHGRMDGNGFYEDLIRKNKYDGQFQGDKFHGSGVYYFSSGKKYVGQFQNSKFNGKGKMIWPNNSFYEGQFVNGLFDGEGKYYEQPQQQVYEGQWKEGKKNGKGKLTYKELEVSGFWINDQLREDI